VGENDITLKISLVFDKCKYLSLPFNYWVKLQYFQLDGYVLKLNNCKTNKQEAGAMHDVCFPATK
jgi:hypothetical protein